MSHRGTFPFLSVGVFAPAFVIAATNILMPIPHPGYTGGPSVRVIGGQPENDPGPSVALYDDLGYECAGTLIENRFVLTAAHCMSHPAQTPGKPVELYPNMTARAGSADRRTGQLRHVARVDLPSSWTGEGGIDLAVVRLDEPVTGVEPALVAPPDPDQDISVSGWGFTANPLPPPFTRPKPPTQIKKIPMRIVDSSHCHSAAITPDELCLTPPTVGPVWLAPGVDGPCRGDSGAGGRQGRNVVAVISRGTSENDLTPCVFGFTVATDVSKNARWIADMIAQG